MECFHVFRKTGPAVANAGFQKLWPNSAIGTNSRTDLVDVRTYSFRNSRHCIDKGYFHREKRVGSVLDKLGALRVGQNQFGFLVPSRWAGHNAFVVVVLAGS